jgi:dihydroxyacetone kinase-like protein
VLVNNYQGDRMAWDMATEMATAEGINARQFWINDDVAVEDSLYTVGRRGVAGNFFVIKACGAAAEQGKSLDEVYAIADRVNKNVRTMGVALTSCIPPAKGTPIFAIGDDEIEVGVGIHGEPGRRREKIKSADAITKELFEAVAQRRAVQRRRPRGDHGQRPRRHADHRALRDLRQGPRAGREGRLQGRAQLRRRVLHQPRDGRRLADHPAPRRELEALLDAPAETAARIF